MNNYDVIVTSCRWRYGCTNIHSLLTYIDSDALQYTINGLGYQLLGGSTDDDIFFIDTVSFTSAPLAIEAVRVVITNNSFNVILLFNFFDSICLHRSQTGSPLIS